MTNGIASPNKMTNASGTISRRRIDQRLEVRHQNQARITAPPMSRQAPISIGDSQSDAFFIRMKFPPQTTQMKMNQAYAIAFPDDRAARYFSPLPSNERACGALRPRVFLSLSSGFPSAVVGALTRGSGAPSSGAPRSAASSLARPRST